MELRHLRYFVAVTGFALNPAPRSAALTMGAPTSRTMQQSTHRDDAHRRGRLCDMAKPLGLVKRRILSRRAVDTSSRRPEYRSVGLGMKAPDCHDSKYHE